MKNKLGLCIVVTVLFQQNIVIGTINQTRSLVMPLSKAVQQTLPSQSTRPFMSVTTPEINDLESIANFKKILKRKAPQEQHIAPVVKAEDVVVASIMHNQFAKLLVAKNEFEHNFAQRSFDNEKFAYDLQQLKDLFIVSDRVLKEIRTISLQAGYIQRPNVCIKELVYSPISERMKSYPKAQLLDKLVKDKAEFDKNMIHVFTQTKNVNTFYLQKQPEVDLRNNNLSIDKFAFNAARNVVGDLLAEIEADQANILKDQEKLAKEKKQLQDYLLNPVINTVENNFLALSDSFKKIETQVKVSSEKNINNKNVIEAEYKEIK